MVEPATASGGASGSTAETATAGATGNARGTIELAVPKLRAGSYFPDWLLEPLRRAEQAFVSVIADACKALTPPADDPEEVMAIEAAA